MFAHILELMQLVSKQNPEVALSWDVVNRLLEGCERLLDLPTIVHIIHFLEVRAFDVRWFHLLLLTLLVRR